MRHFPASQLPSAPAARFAALFAAQPRWTREQLDPYLAGLRVRMLVACLLAGTTRGTKPQQRICRLAALLLDNVL